MRFPFSRNTSLANPLKLRVALTYDKLEPEDEKFAFVAGKEIEKYWNPFRKSRFSNPTVAGWLLIQQFSEYEGDSLLTFFILENSNSDDSESNENHDKGVKRVQRSPQTKRKQRVPMSRKGQAKIRSKPSVAVESTSSTSPTDERTRKLTIKGKAVTVRDPKDDETFLVSVSGGGGPIAFKSDPIEGRSRYVTLPW